MFVLARDECSGRPQVTGPVHHPGQGARRRPGGVGCRGPAAPGRAAAEHPGARARQPSPRLPRRPGARGGAPARRPNLVRVTLGQGRQHLMGRVAGAVQGEARQADTTAAGHTHKEGEQERCDHHLRRTFGMTLWPPGPRVPARVCGLRHHPHRHPPRSWWRLQGASHPYRLMDYDHRVITASRPRAGVDGCPNASPDGTVQATVATIDLRPAGSRLRRRPAGPRPRHTAGRTREF